MEHAITIMFSPFSQLKTELQKMNLWKTCVLTKCYVALLIKTKRLLLRTNNSLYIWTYLSDAFLCNTSLLHVYREEMRHYWNYQRVTKLMEIGTQKCTNRGSSKSITITDLLKKQLLSETNNWIEFKVHYFFSVTSVNTLMAKWNNGFAKIFFT